MLIKIWLLLIVMVAAQSKEEKRQASKEKAAKRIQEKADEYKNKKKEKKWAENRSGNVHKDPQYLENYSFDLPAHKLPIAYDTYGAAI